MNALEYIGFWIGVGLLCIAMLLVGTLDRIIFGG